MGTGHITPLSASEAIELKARPGLRTVIFYSIGSPLGQSRLLLMPSMRPSDFAHLRTFDQALDHVHGHSALLERN